MWRQTHRFQKIDNRKPAFSSSRFRHLLFISAKIKKMAAKTNGLTIDQFEKDLCSFYDYCKENQLTDEEIRRICESLLAIINRAKIARYFKFFVASLIFLTLAYVVLSSEIVSWQLSAIGRILMIKLLPIYDWTHLKNEKCLINSAITNEYGSITDFNCVLCETMTDIDVIFDLDDEVIYENYIKLHTPVILENAFSDWFVQENLTYAILSNEFLSNSVPCKLSTNIYNGLSSLGNIIKKANNFRSFFIHFQNCDFDAVKHFRILVPRPPFLNPEISPIQYSWVLWSKNYNVSKFKMVELQEGITVIGQVTGSNKVQLIPQDDCKSDCKEVEVDLLEGQALILTSLWDFKYKPVAMSENVAVILEAH